MMVANNEKLCKKVEQSLQSDNSPPSARERSPSPSPIVMVKPISQNVHAGDERELGDDRPFDPNLVCLGCKKQF